MTERNEGELITAARAGDVEAMEALLESKQGAVNRFAMKMCRDPEDAKDVLQETLFAAARGLASFRGSSSFSTWLYTIARNSCIRSRVRAPRPQDQEPTHGETRSAEALQVPDPAQLPDDLAARREIERAVASAISELDLMYREVLVLRDVEELTAPETARALGLGVDAVKSRLHRARMSVRESVEATLRPGRPRARRPGCPDVLGFLSRHLEGDIDPGTCARMEEHIADCPDCRDDCDSLRRTLAVCRALPEAPVPADLQESIRVGIRQILAGKP